MISAMKHNYDFPAITSRISGIMNQMDFSWFGSSKGMSTKKFFEQDLAK